MSYSKKFNFHIADTEQACVDFINAKEGREAVSIVHNGVNYAVFYYERIMYYETSLFPARAVDDDWPFLD
jgi:hypothetical protein